MKTKNQKILDWYQKQIDDDQKQLEREKNQFVENIKKLDKAKVFKNTEKEKLSLWKRIKRVLMGI